jgi:hypothetical protein
MSEPFDLMGYIEEESVGGDGGQGWYCKFYVSAGWMHFKSGVTPLERFFSAAEYGKEDAKKMAAAAAGDANVQFVIRLGLIAESVVGRDKPTWKGGVWAHDFPPYQDGYKFVFRPSLKRALDSGLVTDEEHWGKIGFKPDPYHYPDMYDDEGNFIPQSDNEREEIEEWKAYIVRLFDSEEEARAAAGDAETVVDSRFPSEPEEWAKALKQGYGPWNKFCDSQVDLFKSTPNFPLAKLADDSIGLTEEVLSQLRAIALEDEIPF